jgi:RimJ/RimL family protein N-acetyltransferase
LRIPTADDAESVAGEIVDPEVMRYIGRGEIGTPDDAVELVDKLQRAWTADGFGRFIVVRKNDGIAIGRVGLLAWDPAVWRSGIRAEIGAHAEVELGWTLSRAAWGFGYATEAAAAARDWTLREVRPRRLISLIHPENERSMRVARRIGEHHEDTVTTHRGIRAQLWTF